MENPGCSTMEGELQETQKCIPAGDANATPLKNYVSTKSPASPSKVLIITPEQIAKLGLTQQIKSVVESQVASKALHKNRPRVSRISIIDDTPSNSSNKDAALEINQSKKQKDESNEKEAASGSSTASRVNELENTTQNPEEKQDTNTEKRENVKQPKTKETNITKDEVVRNKNILEDDIIIEQEKKVTLTTENDEGMNLNTTNIVVTAKKGKLVVLDTTKGSDIAKETGAKVPYNSLNSSLTNQMISSIRSELSSMLETDTSSAHKSSTSIKDTKPELVTNSENKSKKRYKNLLEDGIITEQEKKVTLTTENYESMKFNTTNIIVTPKKEKLVVQDTTEGSDIAKETGGKVPYNSLNSSLTNQMISSIKSKLSSMLKADIPSPHKSSTSVKDTKPELVTNSENKSKKRKQANCKSSLPSKTSKTVSPTEVPNKPENIPSKTNLCSTNETRCDHLNEKNNTNDSTDTIVSSVDLDVSEITEIATNKSFVKRRIGKVQPRIRKSGKITKKNTEQASVLQIPEIENTNCATSCITVESSNATTDSIGETRPHKIHVLSNEQISLPQTYIKQMLKENFNQNQKINICNPALKKSIPNDSRPTKLISGLDVEQNKITNITGEPNLINSPSKDIPKASYGNENNFSLPLAVDSVLSTSKTEMFKLKDTWSGSDISTSELSGNSNQQNISSSNIGGLVNAKSDSMTKEEIIVSSANSAQKSVVDQSPKKEDLVDTVSNEQSANAVANINMVASKLKEIQTVLPDKLSNQKREENFLTGLKNSTHVDQGITSNAPVSTDINHSQKLKNVTDIPNISELKDLEAKDKLHPLEQKTIAETGIIHPQKLKNVAETSKTIESNKNLGIQNEIYPLDGKTVEQNALVVTVTGVTQNIIQPQKKKIKEKPHSSDAGKPEKKKSVKTRKTSESNRNLETKEKLNTSDSETIAMQSTHPPQNVKNTGTLKISNSDINLEIEEKRLPINVLGKAESSESTTYKATSQLSTKLAAESSIDDFSKQKPPMKIENLSQKPKIPRKLEFVKTEIIKDDIHIPVSFKLTKVDPLSVRHSEESVNHSEKNENEGNKVLTQQVTPTPKKRGRKKKSEMVAKEEPEFRPNVPIIEVGTSKRSGRKRQVVDYSALAEGVEFEEVKPKKPKIEKIKNEHSIVEVATPSIDDSSTDRSLLSVKSMQEVASMDNEVNSFLPLDNEADKESTTEKQGEHEITLIRIEGEYTSEEEVGVLKRKMTQKLTKEPIRTSVSQGFKRKRGRPRGGKKAENNLANKVMNTIFHHINTPTNSNENTEAEEQAIPHNEGMLDNVRQDRGDTPSSVTCAVCYAEMKKSGWQYHKMRKHNNLTWRIGETPLDLSDQKLVVNILTDLYKRRKPLYCEFCEQPKKSVMGFLSHKSICQKTSEEIQSMRIKCEFCEKSVMPISMSAHLKFCKALNPENKVQEDPEQAVIPEMPSTGKRKAATKAEKLIQVFKEDGTFTLINEKPKNTQKWYVNFDFHPTFFATRWIQHQITDHGKMKCIFAECQFESSYAVEMANHIWTCSRKPTEGFTCRFCMTTRQTEDDIVEHMQQNHDRTHTSPLDEESEDNVIEKEEELIDDNIVDYKECKAKPPNKTNLMHGIKFLLMNRFCAPTMGVTYPPAFDWTLKFCHENFSTRNLYSNWRLNWMCYEKLSPDLVIKYLPRVRYSACTARMETKKFVDPLKLDYDWKRYKLFESEMLHNGTSIMFCGGSIFSMAWLPTPFDEPNCEQILAVSTDSSMDKEYRLNDVYREPGLIQFWNCGLLTNEEDSDDKPKLQFCIAHDYGPAWCLEWCPSGCYDVERIEKSDYLQRLGVLAVGCADAHIYIYSINLPDQTGSKIFKTKPVLKLVLDTVAEETVSGIEAHVTKISWSKVSGHQVLVAGYANGMVAIYDLNSTSVLLKAGHDQNDVEMLMPYRIFMAHYHAITALSVYHLNDGRRWLMTGSVDRSIKYWDLENPTVPITNFTKLIVTDGVWLNHWLSTVQTFDDSCGGGLTYTAAHQLRNFESETSTVMLSNSRVSSITGNEWVNGFVQGNTVGEVKGFFPHQMFYSMDGDKSSRSKKVILGYARLVEKNLSVQERIKEEQQKLKHVNSKPAQPVDGDRMIKTKNFNINVDYAKPEPGTYKEAEEKYGLVFCDMRVNCIKEFPANIDSYFKSNKVNKLYASRPNIYPMEAINKVAFNPNRGSFLYLASGYKVGFVRISCLRFLNRI